MKLYEVRLKLKSPAIITSRRTERGFVRPPPWIPGSTIRGAILTALLRDGRIDWKTVESEASNPTFLVSHAYPVIDGVKSIPATPFMMEDRSSGRILDFTRKAVEDILNEGDFNLDFYQGLKEAPKPVFGSIVYKSHDGLRRARIPTFRSTSVAIDKARRTSARGMLFDYEAIAEGTEFWAYMAAPASFNERSLEVAVGRGQSRGFGWATLELRPANISLNAGRRVLVAISPLTPVRVLEGDGCTITVEKAWGRLEKTLTGYDVLRGKFKPIVEVALPGSLVLSEIKGECKGVEAGVPLRIKDEVIAGVNAFMPIEEYFEITGG